MDTRLCVTGVCVLLFVHDEVIVSWGTGVDCVSRADDPLSSPWREELQNTACCYMVMKQKYFCLLKSTSDL